MYHVSEQLINELVATIRNQLASDDEKALKALHYLHSILLKQATCSQQVSQTVAAAYVTLPSTPEPHPEGINSNWYRPDYLPTPSGQRSRPEVQHH